jgi:hypothetical protein
VDPLGKEKFAYKRYAAPWETLRTLEQASPPGQSYLKPAVSLQCLDQIANADSDTESARRMQEAKRKLFLGFRRSEKLHEPLPDPGGAPWKCRAEENQN